MSYRHNFLVCNIGQAHPLTFNHNQVYSMMMNLTFGLFAQVSDSVPQGPLVNFYLSKKIRLDVSSESSAQQRIHLNHQVLFSLRNDENIFMNVVCCSLEWRFKGIIFLKAYC